MANGSAPGPVGSGANDPVIDPGTSARAPSPAPGTLAGNDRRSFDHAIAGLHGEVANAGAIGAIDGATRARYDELVRHYRDDLYAKVQAGKLTWREAAEQAHGLRNDVRAMVRSRSTPIGRAVAERLKSEGPSLNELVARKTMELFGRDADFTRLAPARQNEVFAAIVKSSGKSDPLITARMRTVSRAGRALLFLSISISVYNIATADDTVEAIKHEGTVTAAGIGGGMLGGALAGLACGPGAPVCVTIGAFAGGALAAFGVDFLW